MKNIQVIDSAENSTSSIFAAAEEAFETIFLIGTDIEFSEYAGIRKSDREFVDYVSALTSDQLPERIDFPFTDGALGRMSREEMLMHVITHGVGHRGQISAVMPLNSVAPVKDGFATYLHEAEAVRRRRAA
jgi:uncharacterized damage-inducible protein DinB